MTETAPGFLNQTGVPLTRPRELAMIRWLLLLTVTASCLGSLSTARAQDNPWSGEPGRFIPWDGNGAWSPYAGYPQMDTPYGSAPSPHSAPPSNPAIVNRGPYPRPQSIYEFQPQGDVRGPFYENSNGGARLRDALNNAFIRVEYLHWEMTNPGSNLIGANWINANARDVFRQPGNPNPNSATVVPLVRERDGTVRVDLDDDIENNLLIYPQAYDLNQFEYKNRNGLRLVGGINTEDGTIEANVWGMDKSVESFRVTPVANFATREVLMPTIPLMNNGRLVDPTIALSAPMISFDDYMHVQFSTEFFGTEANYFRRLTPKDSPFQVSLSAGARYVRLAEDLNITGHDQQHLLDPQILATSTNSIFGPSVGLRVSLDHWIFRLGAESRVTAAFNRNKNLVRSADLFPQMRNPAQHNADQTDFSPMHELQLYAQAKVTERLNVRVGYNLMQIFGVARPQNKVVWDDSGVVDGPVLLRMSDDGMKTFRASGLFVSGELFLY